MAAGLPAATVAPARRWRSFATQNANKDTDPMKSLIARFRNLKFAYKIALLPIAAGLALLLQIGEAWLAGQSNLEQLEEIEYRNASTATMDALFELLEDTQETLESAVSTGDADMLEQAETLRGRFEAAVENGLDNPVVDRARLQAVREDYLAYYEIASRVSERMMADDMSAGVFARMEQANERLASLTGTLDDQRAADEAALVEAFAAAERRVEAGVLVGLIIAGVAFGALGLLSWVIIRALTRDVGEAAESMRALAAGDLSNRPVPRSSDEIGAMLGQLVGVEDTLEQMTSEVDQLVECVRDGRLDQRGDESRFDGAYAQLIRNVNELIDAFVQPINVTADYVERIAGGEIPEPIRHEYRGDFNLIRNNLNTLVGVMGGLAGQIDSLASEVRNGNLAARAEGADFEGTWKNLVVGLNGLVDAFVQPLEVTKTYLDRIARGDIPDPIRHEYRGDFNEIRDNLNTLVGVMGGLIEQVEGVTREIRSGNLGARGDADRFSGAWGELVRGLDALVDAFVMPIEVTKAYVERIARGDIPEAISQEYRGDFNQIKENLNRLVGVMDGLVDQAGGIVDAARRGELDARARSADFDGVWRELVDGLNGTMDAVERPIGAVSDVMGAMSRGDISRRMEGEYHGAFGRLRDDVNATIEQLLRVISSIKEASGSVAGAAREISSGNMSLSQRTEQQSASLENTTANMDELLSLVHANTERASDASKSVRAAHEKAEQGGDVADQAVSAMQEILDASRSMAEIIGVIDEIAHQTNLLALNAAVEAADAGEQGRGFAVVAAEVRSLAGRSKEAARQIGDLIKDSAHKIEHGSGLVDASGDRLREIVAAVSKAAEISDEIERASQEQSDNISGVHGSVREMESVTQQNAALAEEAMAASESLEKMARTLDEQVAFFSTGSDGADSARGNEGLRLVESG